jgi:ribosomal subunit interface protein
VGLIDFAMKITIKATNLELGEVLKKKIEKKINSLEKFAKRIFGKKYWDGFFGKGRPRAEAFVEIAKSSGHHRKGLVFYAECQIRFPGKSLRAEAQRESLELAINEVKEELKREIKKFKGKLVAKYERGARKAKRKLLLSKLAQKKEGKRNLQEGI